MALSKLVMKRGTYIKGYQLTVSTTAKDYTLDVDRTDSFFVTNVQLLADDSDSGDYYTVSHLDTTAAGASIKRKLGDTLYNPGPGMAVSLDFPGIEYFDPDDSLRVTYTHAASTASIAVTAYVTFVGPINTS